MTTTARGGTLVSHMDLVDEIDDGPHGGCLCGHSEEDHQGSDGSGADASCSEWDCECEFFAGLDTEEETPSILSAETGKVNHKIVVLDQEEGASR